MMKRIYLTALFVVASIITSFADEQKKITLNDKDHKTELIELAYCNIFVSLKDVDDNDNAQIAVELENTHESYILLLFDRAYDEKTLKKMSTSISYDKSYPRSMDRCDIDACQDINRTIGLNPSQKTNLFSKSCTVNSPVVCRLPIYIALKKNKSGSKISLWAKDVIELEVLVQLKPDEEFISIDKECNSLMEEIKDLTFCAWKKHKEEKTIKSLKTRGEYEGKINDLKKRIKETIESRGYYPQDKAYKKFMEIHDSIDTISLEKRTIAKCARCRRIPPIPDPLPRCCPKNNCAYCSLSSDAIYNKMQDYYIAIHNGQKKKQQVISEVEGLYTCLIKCKKRKNDSKKSRAITYYSKIKSL